MRPLDQLRDGLRGQQQGGCWGGDSRQGMAGRAPRPLPTLPVLSRRACPPCPCAAPGVRPAPDPPHRNEALGVAPWTTDPSPRGLLTPPGWVVGPAPCTQMLLSSPQAWGHRAVPPAWLPVTRLPYLGVSDAALLLQDLICVLIDDGGFLVLSNQEDHWYQVSGGHMAALLGVRCHWGAETSELMSPVACHSPARVSAGEDPQHGVIWVQTRCPHSRWASSSVRWTPT